MRKSRSGSFWIVLGVLFLLGAAGLSVFNIWDSRRAGDSVKEIAEEMSAGIPMAEETRAAAEVPEEDSFLAGEYEIPDYILNPDMEMPVQVIDGNEYIGVLEIPKLDLVLPVASEWSYPKLRKTPCRYDGTVYKGNLIVSAHNYDSHFGKLKNLQEGETVTFTDMDGNVFRYEVSSRETIMPEDIEGMKSGDWDLTMFTCTYGGQQRVTVRCELVEDK